MLQQLVASNFAKDRENVGRELCVTLLFLFISLFVVLRLRDDPKKKYFEHTEMGGHKQPLTGAHPLPPPPPATALSILRS